MQHQNPNTEPSSLPSLASPLTTAANTYHAAEFLIDSPWSFLPTDIIELVTNANCSIILQFHIDTFLVGVQQQQKADELRTAKRQGKDAAWRVEGDRGSFSFFVAQNFARAVIKRPSRIKVIIYRRGMSHHTRCAPARHADIPRRCLMLLSLGLEGSRVVHGIGRTSFLNLI